MFWRRSGGRAVTRATIRWRHLLVAGFAILMAACAAPPVLHTPGAVPDLRGTWTGTWAGRPLTVLIVDQADAADASVRLGSWPVLGTPLSGLTGMMTFSVSGRPTSANLRGRLGRTGSGLTLVLEPLTQDGDWIELHLVGEGHATGIGNSRWRAEARGAVELWRQAGPR